MGKNSDAKITEHMLNSSFEEIIDWFEKYEIFLIDRCFRDTVDILKILGSMLKCLTSLTNSRNNIPLKGQMSLGPLQR